MQLDVGLLRKYASEGLTRIEIAKKMGMSYSRTTSVLRESGIPVKRKKHECQKLEPTERTKKILSLRRDGMKRSEIAEIIGCSVDAVSAVCTKYGVRLESTAKTEDYARELVESTGYDYIGGFKNGHSTIMIRCRICGTIYKRGYANIRKEHFGCYPNKPQCPGCNKKLAEEKEREIKREAQEMKRAKARHKAEQLSRQANEEMARRLAIHVCKNCGKEYCISCTGYDSKTYCSKRCQSRWHDRMKNDKRMDRLKSRRHDTDITLEKLYSRDGGVCYICGKRCDWSDGEMVNETFIAGDNYPSIDHVKPVAKGGTHTWDNIKLACRHCNTLKGWN